jgi:uncharacterized protein involved in response to NO
MNRTEKQSAAKPLPIFALGFRPFYLLAIILAAVALPVWLGVYFGIIAPSGYLSGIAWHSHEMLFGFVVAVIAGFLLTAVRNWTGLPTPTGIALSILAGIWLLARILMWTGPAALAAVVDLSFLPALAVAIAIPIARSRNRRNFKVLLILVGLGGANLAFHLTMLGVLPVGVDRLSIVVTLDIIMILMAIMAGRVIPAFTRNAVAGAHPRQVLSIEVLALGSLVLILIAEIGSFWFAIDTVLWCALFATAAIMHVIRLLLWQPFRARHDPLLWMLPVAYAWIPVALFFRAVATLPTGIPETVAFHALTTGAMASLMTAMMTRSALGHTGRELKAGRIEISVFLLIQAAALTRIVPGLIWPQHYPTYMTVSAGLWSLAFIVFLSRYWSILSRARIDGKPG